MTSTHALKLHRNAEKQLQRIPKKHQERVINTMRSLREDPRPPGCTKLDDVLYRVRQGQYRIIYAVFYNHVVVVICKVVRKPEDIYKNLPTLLARAENVLGNNP